jgi:hypothetical protein
MGVMMYYNVGDVCSVYRKKSYPAFKKILKGKEYFLGVRVNSSGSSHFGN